MPECDICDAIFEAAESKEHYASHRVRPADSCNPLFDLAADDFFSARRLDALGLSASAQDRLQAGIRSLRENESIGTMRDFLMRYPRRTDIASKPGISEKAATAITFVIRSAALPFPD